MENEYMSISHAATPDQPVKQYAKDLDALCTGRLDAIQPSTPMPQCSLKESR